jgi:hypothetical protein
MSLRPVVWFGEPVLVVYLCLFALDDIIRSLICCHVFYFVNFQSVSDVKVHVEVQYCKSLKYSYRNTSLFDALVLFCIRGEEDDGYDFDVYFCSQTYFCTRLFIPLIHRLFLRVYNNEDGTCHTGA